MSSQPSPKRKRSVSPAASSSQSVVASYNQGSVASPSRTLSQGSSQLTPGRSGESLSQELVSHWGACYRCGNYGHFAQDCIMGSKIFKGASWSPNPCQLCSGSIVDMDCCFPDADLDLRHEPVHVWCHLDMLKMADRARKRLRLAPVAEDEAPSEEDPVAAILGSIDTTDRSIGVNARAGSGKTYVIATAVRKVRARGERLLALTLNRDACVELKDRKVVEARTYHSLGAKAWFRAHPRGSLVTEEEDEEEVAEKAAAVADDCAANEAPVQEQYMPNKTKLLLQKLYPKQPDDPGRGGTKSLDCALFDRFVEKMVSLAKMEGVGVRGGREDDWATWEMLCENHSLGDLIEVTLKKKLSKARFDAVQQRWPTPVARRNHGIDMAWNCFQASITVAQQTSWQVERGGEVVTELGGGSGERKKAKSLPLLDFDDLLYMPMLEELDLDPGPPKHVTRKMRASCPSSAWQGPLRWVFADESQDNSRIRLLMLLKLVSEGVRFFGVGDDMQALYGWAFALPDALDELFKLFDCKVHTLPVCRRCPAMHIEMANRVIDDATGGEGAAMRPMPHALEGRIVTDADFETNPLTSNALITSGHAAAAAAAGGEEQKEMVKSDKVIMARRNAPLLAMLFLLASKGIACRMLGKAPLAQKLAKLLKELYYDGRPPQTLDEVESALDGHVHREQEARQGSDESKGAEYSLGDLAECVKLLIGSVRQAGAQRSGEEELEALNEEIKSQFGTARGQYILPSQQVQAVELSTVHKAKGLGWPIVYLLEPQELPLEFVLEQGGWQARQELNVQYVAYTRSERDLIFLRNVIPSPKPEGFSLHDALRTLFVGAQGGGAPGGRARRGPHPRHDPNWEARSAFDDWRRYHQQQATDPEAAPDDQEWAKACSVLAQELAQARLPPLPKSLTESEVDKVYKQLALRLHPDRAGSGMTQRFQQLIAARGLLKDALQRMAEY